MDEYNLNHLPPLPASLGPESTVSQNFSDMMDKQWRIDSILGSQSMFEEMYQKNLDEVKRLTGEDLTLPSYTGYSSIQPGLSRLQGQDPGSYFVPEGITSELLGALDKNEARIQELKKTNPGLKGLDDLYKDLTVSRAEIEQRAGRTAETAGWAGWAAGVAGSMVGSFSYNDPVNLATIMVGGVGKSLLMRLGTEALAQGGIEAVNQFGFVQPERARLGEAPGDPWSNIAYAAGGAVVLRGAGEAGAKGFRALERTIAPQRAYARVIEQEMSRGPDNAALRNYLINLPDTPTKRAVSHLIDANDMVRQLNPYGDTMAGLQRAEMDIQNVVNSYDGRPATAVDQFANLDGPVLMQDLAYEQAVVRETQPALMREFDRTSAVADAASDRVRELEGFLAQRTVADAVGMIDEPSGLRVREIEAELEQAIPAQRKQALESELDSIVQNIGEDRIAKAENDFRIGPKKELGIARRNAKAARTELSRVSRDVESAANEVKARNAAAARVNDMLGILNRSEDPFLVPKPDRAVEMATAQRAANEVTPEVADGIVTRNKPPEPKAEGAKSADAEPTAPKNPGVDVGLEKNVPNDTPVVTVDAAGNVQMISARKVMDDLIASDNLLDAMKVCAI